MISIFMTKRILHSFLPSHDRKSKSSLLKKLVEFYVIESVHTNLSSMETSRRQNGMGKHTRLHEIDTPKPIFRILLPLIEEWRLL